MLVTDSWFSELGYFIVKLPGTGSGTQLLRLLGIFILDSAIFPALRHTGSLLELSSNRP